MKKMLVGRQNSKGGLDIAIPASEDTVGRRHLEVAEQPDGQFLIKDLGSANGTFIRRGGQWQQVSSACVRRNDEIMLGEYCTRVGDLLALGSPEGIEPNRRQPPPPPRQRREIDEEYEDEGEYADPPSPVIAKTDVKVPGIKEGLTTIAVVGLIIACALTTPNKLDHIKAAKEQNPRFGEFVEEGLSSGELVFANYIVLSLVTKPGKGKDASGKANSTVPISLGVLKNVFTLYTLVQGRSSQ
jgi:pSer/pThr/pTyr-binding forkhead associated (FHA) protein